MLSSYTIISIIEVILLILPVLLTVAFVTVAERKTMASMQRRLSPNIVGYYGLLQAFADALKLIPTQANLALFFLGPVVTLIFSLLGYAVLSYGPGLAIWDFNLGILYILAVSSLATYGILLAAWSSSIVHEILSEDIKMNYVITYFFALKSLIFIASLTLAPLSLPISILLWGILVVCTSVVYYFYFGRLISLYDFRYIFIKSLPYNICFQIIIFIIICIFCPSFFMVFIDAINFVLYINDNAIVMEALDKQLFLLGRPLFFSVSEFLDRVGNNSFFFKALFQAYVDSAPSGVMRTPQQTMLYMSNFKSSNLLENGYYSRIALQLIHNGGGFRPKL